MPFHHTPFQDLTIFEPTVLKDERGYFFESFNQREFETAGIHAAFVQDNQVFSTIGVLRGLHYQVFPFAQAKLIRVIQGSILDVVVDIRQELPTYGQYYSMVLDDVTHQQLFVPRGFAHGYLVLSETALVSYKCDNFYSPDHEGGIRFDDPTLKIDWQFDAGRLVVSEKDKAQPLFGNHPQI